MYYAIAGCKAPTVTSSAAVVASSSAATSLPTSKQNDEGRGTDARHDGVIAGTVIATISGVALIFTGILVLLRRQPREVQEKSLELSNDRALMETVSVEKHVAKELWADHAVAEMGRNSQFEESLRRSLEKPGMGEQCRTNRE